MEEIIEYAKQQLNKETDNKGRTNENEAFSHCSTCSAPTILRIFSTIKDISIIIHSPTGCAASFVDFNRKYKSELKSRNVKIKNPYFISTNLNEKDIICGIDSNLEKAIYDTVEKFHPKVIFVSASCGSGVSGYDIQQVIDNLKDKVDIPIVTIVCEIYGPKKWGSGFNGSKYGVFREIVRPLNKRKKFYNIIDFNDNSEIRNLLNKTEINWNYISCYCDYECFEIMADAKATFLITTDRFSNYLANWLEKEFSIPKIQVTNPCGFNATDSFLIEIGKFVNKENIFNEIIIEQREKYENQFNEFKQRLKRIKVLPIVSGEVNLNKIKMMLKEFEINILVSDNKTHESITKKEKNNIKKKKLDENNNVFELIEIAKKMNPDIIIARESYFTACGARIGYPTFWIEEENELYGYFGMIKFGNKLLTSLYSKNFYRQLAKHSGLPYENLQLKY